MDLLSMFQLVIHCQAHHQLRSKWSYVSEGHSIHLLEIARQCKTLIKTRTMPIILTCFGMIELSDTEIRIIWLLFAHIKRKEVYLLYNQQFSIEMNTNKRVKKLKTLNSFQTACTLQENVQGGIKINVISPRSLKRNSQLKGSTSIVESPHQEELITSNTGMSRDMVAIPMLVNRQSNNSEKKNFNSLSPRNQEMSKILLKQGQNNQQNQSVVHISGSELFTSLTNSQTSMKSKQALQKILSAQKVDVKGNSIMLSQPVHQNSSDLDNIGGKKERQKDLVGKVGRTELQKQKELFRLCIDHEQSVYIRSSQNCKNSDDFQSRLRPVPSKVQIAAESPKISQKYEKLRQERSQSRLKLRDYLYMAHTSRTKAVVERRQMVFQRKVSPIHADEAKITSVSTTDRTEGIKTNESKKNTVDIDPRQNYINKKYKISNTQMFEILKRQVCTELATLRDNITNIEQELSQVQVQENQAQGDQLLILYNLRRQIKDHISRRVQMAMDSIQRNKVKGQLKNRKKSEDEVLEEMSCSVFLENNQS